MTYRIEVFGHLDTTSNMVHLFGIDNLTLDQALVEIKDLNEENYVYRIALETTE
jgi:hypothetical protein